jgi:hypothetical protein
VTVIIVTDDDKDTEEKLSTPEYTPTEIVIEGIYQGLYQALSGDTLPLEQMWVGIDRP